MWARIITAGAVSGQSALVAVFDVTRTLLLCLQARVITCRSILWLWSEGGGLRICLESSTRSAEGSEWRRDNYGVGVRYAEGMSVGGMS